MIEQMKPSGVDYLGDIPATWTAKRFKYCAQICNGGEYADIEIDEGGYPVIGSGGEFARASKFCYQGESVLLGRKGTIDKPLYVNNAFWCVDTMFYTKAKLNMIPKFLYYCALCFRFDYYVTSTALPSMTQKDLGSEIIAVPPTEEQKQIAMFLDSQCSKLDGIIADLEKQIDTLQKYKKSLITETVTKGLDKSVPMKDSGIEWIGQIPEHWSVKRLKYVMNNFDSQRKPIEAQNRSQEGDVLYDYYGASGVIDKIDEYIFDETALLIGEDGANLVLRNLPLIYIAHGKYWVNNHAHILRPKKDSDLYYMAHQMEIIDYSLFITGSAQPKLSQENLNNVILVVPPLSEQKTMAEYLNEKISNIDSIIQDKKKQLTIVQGHKKSLIYEYVTGKKRVTEVK